MPPRHHAADQLRRSYSDSGARSKPDAWSQASSSRLGEERTYQFMPLREGDIRLIRILPVRRTIVRCEIVHASLSDPPPYAAVSYAWGDPGETREIEVEGVMVRVSVSLHGALQALRERDIAIMVWADALCIDQQNKKERARQVQLMRSIYSKADAVVIWLGPEEDDSIGAVNFMEEISKLAKRPAKVASILSSRDSIEDLVAVAALFDRPYWRRLWVVQEVFNATKVLVYCGTTIATWDMYRTASELFYRHREDIFDLLAHWTDTFPSTSPDQYSHDQVLVYQGPAGLPDLRSALNNRASLLEVLCDCRRKLSSDPRDKLYGILGILHPEVRREFRPDYNLSVKEVYSGIVDYLLATTRRLDVICESIHFPPHTDSHNLPSFVPDWSHNPPVASLRRKYRYSASGSEKAVCRFLDERLNRLEISAIYLDTVEVKGLAVGSMCNVGDYLMAFLQWRALLLENIAREPDDVRQIVQEDFAETLALGQIPSTPAKKSQWLSACYNVFGKLICERLPHLAIDRSLERYLDLKVGVTSDERRQFLQKNFGEMMMGRCFFITKNNYLGMGSGFMLPGDKVVVPLGCSTPIILRELKQKGTQKEYRYVGDAYVNGYMHGKAVDDLMSKTRKEGKYILR